MSRPALAFTILVLALAACGPAVAQPSGAPSQGPASPSAPPSGVPPASPSVPAPVPTPPASEAPTPVVLTSDERYLLDGVLRGAIDCRPVRDALPGQAIAGIECGSDDPAVARVGFYLFASDEDMLDVYFHRMRLEGVELDTGGCLDGEGEGAYIPEEGPQPDRHGCFVNGEGYANYRATISGTHLYIGVLGRTANMRALLDFAWVGSQDVPGTPTLWGDPNP